MFERLDNLDKDNAEEVAYFIWTECSHINEDDIMSTKFYDACYAIYEEYSMNAPWHEVWKEIKEYI